MCNLPLKKRVRIILTLDLSKSYGATLSEKLCACVPLSLRLYCEIRPLMGAIQSRVLRTRILY